MKRMQGRGGWRAGPSFPPTTSSCPTSLPTLITLVFSDWVFRQNHQKSGFDREGTHQAEPRMHRKPESGALSSLSVFAFPDHSCLPPVSLLGSCFPPTELEPPDLQPPLSPKRHTTVRQKKRTFANNAGPFFCLFSLFLKLAIFWLIEKQLSKNNFLSVTSLTWCNQICHTITI